MIITTYALSGSAFTALGLFTLYTAWNAKRIRREQRITGWLTLIASLVLWAYAAGKDRGVAIGLIVFSLLALCIIAWQAYKDKSLNKRAGRQKTSRTKSAPSTTRISKRDYAVRVLIALWVFLGCGLLAFLVAISIHESLWQLNVHASNSLVTTLFLFPILWSTFSAFSLISHNKKLKIIFFTSLLVITTVILAAYNFR